MIKGDMIITGKTDTTDPTGRKGTKIFYKKISVNSGGLPIPRKDNFVIWNGKDGAQGNTPDISVRKGTGSADSDAYYWTIDGKDITDKEGQPIRVNGKDGETPTILRGDAFLEKYNLTIGEVKQHMPDFQTTSILMYFKGQTFLLSGPEGPEGPAGDPGDSFFTNVTKDDYIVTFYLASGDSIKVPTWAWAQKTEQAINETNGRIDALKNLLDTMKFIKSFKGETDADNRTKYTIELVYINGNDAGTYELTSGAKGDPGKDGKTPTIGIAADPNNNNDLFWTVNGKFIPDPNNPGKNVPVLGGKDGNDAPTPRLELGSTVISDGKNEDADEETIVATNVYLSVDGGTTWRKVNGDNGKDGEPVIKEVDTTNKDYVTFKLKDGTSFDVPRYVEVTVQFAVTTEIFRLPKNSYQDVGFTIEGTAAPTLSLTTIVGGNWKIRQNYNSGELSGTLTVYAPGTWDYNKVVLLLSDKKGRVWTNSLKVETEWTIGDPFVDSRDERTYSIKQFGDKLWMTEDLKHNSANGYAYSDLTDLCPTDWRVPDNDDWSNLATNLDASLFGSPQTNGGWWSSTSLDGNGNATVWTINAPSLGHETIAPNLKRGVRCIKDGTNPYDTPSSGN